MMEPNKIRELRGAAGLTQGQLAELVGCTEGSVCRIEAGKQKPGAALLHRLMQVLLNERQEPPPPPADDISRDLAALTPEQWTVVLNLIRVLAGQVHT